MKLYKQLETLWLWEKRSTNNDIPFELHHDLFSATGDAMEGNGFTYLFPLCIGRDEQSQDCDYSYPQQPEKVLYLQDNMLVLQTGKCWRFSGRKKQ